MISPCREDGSQGEEGSVRNLAVSGETAVDEPFDEVGAIGVELQQQDNRLLGQLVHLQENADA